MQFRGLGDINPLVMIPMAVVYLIDYRAVAAGGAVALSKVPRPYLAAAAVGGGFYQLDSMDRDKFPHNSTPGTDKMFVLAVKMGSAGLGLLAVRRII